MQEMPDVTAAEIAPKIVRVCGSVSRAIEFATKTVRACDSSGDWDTAAYWTGVIEILKTRGND